LRHLKSTEKIFSIFHLFKAQNGNEGKIDLIPSIVVYVRLDDASRWSLYDDWGRMGLEEEYGVPDGRNKYGEALGGVCIVSVLDLKILKDQF